MRKIIAICFCLVMPSLCLADETITVTPQFEQTEENTTQSGPADDETAETGQPFQATQAASTRPFDLTWVGGSLRTAEETKPLLSADLHAELGNFNGLRIFTQPLVSIQSSDPAFSLSLGGRLPVMNEQAVAGGNIFLDWTSRNHHRRIGLGAEFLHKDFALNVNAYLPFSDTKGREEAIPGLDVSVGVPIPGYEFLSVRPGFYLYNGDDADDVRGVSLAIEARPVEIFDFSLGIRGDALDSGRDEVQAFAQIRLTYPMRRLGRDILNFNQNGFTQVPGPCYSARIVRENQITFERKP